jgi:hypothetical protein
MTFLHSIRDTVIRDKVRTILQKKPLMDRCSRGNNRCTRKAALE